jgi:hypothetical protein
VRRQQQAAATCAPQRNGCRTVTHSMQVVGCARILLQSVGSCSATAANEHLYTRSTGPADATCTCVLASLLRTQPGRAAQSRLPPTAAPHLFTLSTPWCSRPARIPPCTSLIGRCSV